MPKVTYITFDGAEHAVDVPTGLSAMEGAVQNAIPGIDGDCGGAAACGTCHVFVDPAWIAKAGTPGSTIEKEMLELTDNVAANSRLSCQIKLTAELDGLMLRMPLGQH
jgi:2Fe-2S ferredoxin